MKSNVGDCLEEGREVVLELAADLCETYAGVRRAYQRHYGYPQRNDGCADDWRRDCGSAPDFLHDFTVLSLNYLNQVARMSSGYSGLVCRSLSRWYDAMSPQAEDGPAQCLRFSGLRSARVAQRLKVCNNGATRETFRFYPARVQVKDEPEWLPTSVHIAGTAHDVRHSPVPLTLQPGERRALVIELELELEPGCHRGTLRVERADGHLLQQPIELEVYAP